MKGATLMNAHCTSLRDDVEKDNCGTRVRNNNCDRMNYFGPAWDPLLKSNTLAIKVASTSKFLSACLQSRVLDLERSVKNSCMWITVDILFN